MNIKFAPKIRTITMASVLALPLSTAQILANTEVKNDTFEYSVKPSGSCDSKVLSQSPSAEVTIDGTEYKAKIVVDLSHNILYKYDEFGNPETAYLVASGAHSTPTEKGIRIVTHTEAYPYRSAYGTKRKRNPRAYGPKVICLNKINPKTGEQSSTGEFIHGNNDIKSLGKYASHGCIRMDNDVIVALAKEVKRGDIVIIK